MHSLRARLLYRTCGVVTLTLVIAAIALYLLIRASLFAELDTSLLLEATSLATHVEQSHDELQIESAVTALPEYSSAARPHFFQVWKADGQSAIRSPSLTGDDLPHPALADRLANRQPPVRLSSRLLDGTTRRIAAIVFQPRLEDDEYPPDAPAGHPPAMLAVARSTAEIDATLARLAMLLGAVTFATVVVCIALTGGVVGHELQPLRSLAGSIERLDATDMSQRIEIGACPQELTPVVDCLNQLLGRVETTLVREKSFTADVAHELRTPLAGLETTLEVCASRSRDVAAYQTVVANCLGITRNLHRLVDNLLRLARADSNQFALTVQPLEITSFLREGWSEFAQQAADRGLHVEWLLDRPANWLADHELAHQIFANLYDNAVTYADSGGRIRIACSRAANRCLVTIANTGCSLSAREVERAFDRFWRGDAARSSGGLHCGLGLALCRKFVELQHGCIHANVQDGWFSVSVELDTAAAPA